MRPPLSLLGALALLLAPAHSLQAEEVQKPRYVVGDVTAVDAASRTLTLKTDAGKAVAATVAPGASLLRAKPGDTTLTEAAPVSLPDVVVGDRVMLHGFLSQDGALDARKVVIMTRGDIAQKQQAEQADWRRRGLVAVVTEVDPAKGEILVRLGRRPDAPSLIIETAGRPVTFRRYAPDSVKFSDARPSRLEDVRVGDELRALGERSTDGNRLTAEQVVSGAFRVISGPVTAVVAEKGEVTLKDDESEKPVTVSVGPDARLRRLPPEIAHRFGRAPSPEGSPAPSPGGGAPRVRRGGGSAAEELLAGLPPITLSELKVGDRILVSSTKGSDATRMNAIVVVAGLEQLPAPPASRRGRGADVGLPADLIDLGLSLQ
jgi:hypothetical protein